MKTAIFTVVDNEYSAYIPLFEYCLRRAYPECEPLVYSRFKNDDFPEGGPVTAAMRFIIEPNLSVYDNILITDADIMFEREAKPFWEQHLEFMERHGLVCYSNSDRGDHMTGVHFVTKDWWDISRNAREKAAERLKTDSVVKGYDEAMLCRIVLDSGLKTTKTPNLWNIHGVHLGRYRRDRPLPSGPDVRAAERLFADTIFRELIEAAASKGGVVKKVLDNIKRSYREGRGKEL